LSEAFSFPFFCAGVLVLLSAFSSSLLVFFGVGAVFAFFFSFFAFLGAGVASTSSSAPSSPLSPITSSSSASGLRCRFARISAAVVALSGSSFAFFARLCSSLLCLRLLH
jgi:hypothetical protein